MKIYNDITKVDLPVLNNGQVYIYILENYPQGNIKIGQSTNIQNRIKSLSGSNSGGNKIVKCAISDATWLASLEQVMHIHFNAARIEGTEWFNGEKITFDETVLYMCSLFTSAEYEKCNQLRAKYNVLSSREKDKLCA